MLQRLAVLLSAAAFAVACGQTDPGITTAVKTKFAADDTVKAYQINVSTDNKVVTLEGAVETAAAKDQAIRLARDTDGVRDVVDRLTVNEAAATTGIDDKMRESAEKAGDKAGEMKDKTADAARRGVEATKEAGREAGVVMTDAAITTAVKSKLLADTAVAGLKIDVDTKDAVVTLSGRVNSQAEANEAVRLARNTTGVTSVKNNLQVGR